MFSLNQTKKKGETHASTCENSGGGQPRWLNLLVLSLLVGIPILAISPTAKAETNNDAIVVSADGTEATIQGNCASDEIYSTLQPYKSTLTTVTFDGQIEIVAKPIDPLSLDDAWFAELAELTSVKSTDGTRVSFVPVDSETPSSLAGLFFKDQKLQSIDGLACWDTSGVTDLSYAFNSCEALESLEPLANWDVSDVTSLSATFSSCAIKTLEPLANWDVSNVTDMQSLFKSCIQLSTLEPLRFWDVENVINMVSSFEGCFDLQSLDGVDVWNVSNVENLAGTFNSCTSIVNVDALSSWNVQGVKTVFQLFENCSNLKSLSGLRSWRLKNLETIERRHPLFSTFHLCTSLETLDGLESWDISYCEDPSWLNSTFAECTSLKNIDALASWKLPTVSLGDQGTFVLSPNISSMTLNSDFYVASWLQLPSATWWKVGANPSVTKTTQELAALTPAEQAGRWQIVPTGSTDPMQDVSISATWANGTVTTYNAQNQQVLPTSVVTEDGKELQYGVDYYVTYTKDGATTTSIFDAGTYTAEVVLRGAYVGYSLSQPVTMEALDLAGQVYLPKLILENDTYEYTASAITPRAILQLDLGKAYTPDGVEYERYSYLFARTDERPKGSYTYSFANNTRPGNHTAIAIASGISPNTINSAQTRFSITTYLVDIYFDPDGGEWKEGDTSTTKISQYYNGVLVTPERLPKRVGYNFVGWYDESGNPAPDFTPASSKTYYAGWEEIPKPTPYEPGWHEDDTGWQYISQDGNLTYGWLNLDGTWYYFDDAGYAVHDMWLWNEDFGPHWYYFWNNCAMATNAWLWDGAWYWVCSTGPMIQGLWQWIDNAWYGFWWNGQMCQGWVWDNAYVAWFYCYNNGVVARNAWVDGYYLSDSGICLL